MQKFDEYYKQSSEKIPLPSYLKRREFAFILFKEQMMLRHKAFRDPEQLTHFIKTITPSNVYYSAAHYENPSREMRKKGWIGADLIFDIDSDHLPSKCVTTHKFWTCEKCYTGGRGGSPLNCPRCGNTSTKEVAWLCETCLEAAKLEAQKLVDFLLGDFGFSNRDLDIVFSGQRGYHIHIQKKNILQLDQDARKEIVDYVVGTGLAINLHGLVEVGKGRWRQVTGPDLKDPGWRGRIARGVYDLLVSSDPQMIGKVTGVKRNTQRIIERRRETILNSWNSGRPWGLIKGIGIKTWEKLAEFGIKNQMVKIDTVVTTDLHRLIRMPSTLHGKTGLRATLIPLKSLITFDPLTEAIAFKEGMLKVYVNEAHEFRLGDHLYGPYKKEKVKIPMAAAIYLLCKRAAKLVE